ncbi:MAG TPA: hypothetical protein VMJ92_00795 [Candidatus Limnocylindrales bacterium]|nr:hypothetical protein [Candidatus Limnocylindrales bacterium]
MRGAAPIAYVCEHPEHREDVRPAAMDRLTVFRGEWAYCRHDARANEHRWVKTGGLPVEEVVAFGGGLSARR